MISEEEFSKIKEYYEKVIQLVRYNKAKDDVIEKTGKEIQRYRDGFSLSAFKPLAVSIINFRENCKKELADLDKYEYDEAKLKKNFGYLIDDLQDVMLENGVDEVENGYEYCGKNIMQPLSFGEAQEEKTVVQPAEQPVKEAQTQPEVVSEAAVADADSNDEQSEKTYDLAETLAAYQEQIVQTLADNSKIETLLKDTFEGARERDNDNKRIFIYPVFYRLAFLKDKLSQKCEIFPENSENAKGEYGEILGGVVSELCDILQLMGVTAEIMHPESDKIVSGYHQLIKVVATNVEEYDRKVARTITDAYLMDGKVIYPQKVEVYKFKK